MKIAFSDIFEWVKGYKRELFIANLIAILAVSVSLFIPLLIPYLIDEIILKKPGKVLATIDFFFTPPHSPLFYIFATLVLTITLRAIYLFLSSIQTLYFTKISKDITYKIQKRLLEHLKGVGLKSFEDFGSGKISSLLIVDVATIDTFLSQSISKFIISVLSIIGIGGVLIYIDWKLGLFILTFMPIVVYFTKKIARKVGEIKRKQNEKIASFQESLGESLDLFWQIKASNKEREFFDALVDSAKQIKDISVEFSYKSEVSALFSYFLFLAGFEVFRSAGILSVELKDISIGQMLAIFGYLWVIMSPFQEILNMQYSFHNAKTALQRVNGIFELELEPRYPHLKDPFSTKRTNSLVLKDIYFSHDGEHMTLKGVNFKADEGQKVAIVGESGGGKSTLAQLMVGFYEPDRGDISIDGISYKEIGLDKIREHIFLVLQSPLLFNNSIKYNLTLGEDVDSKKLERAIEVARLKEFIDSLDDGIETMIGRNGVRLSGGQRQRLSIARMIVAEPNIVILDESTSSLDVETEEILFSELSSFLKERTTIIIAHRLSTITQADYIYLLENGVIEEEGSFDELLKLGGHFAKYINKGIRC